MEPDRDFRPFLLFLLIVIAILGRPVYGKELVEAGMQERIFIRFATDLFPPFVAGILLSAILAASMSTADSQLLSAASSFSSDVYKPLIRKNEPSNAEMIWNSRLVVLVIALLALVLATDPGAGSIMSLVSNAWGVFGAAFGPVILLSLYWKRLNYAGALTGIITGAAVDILWLIFLSGTGVYEIIPGFICGLVAAIVVALKTEAPSKEVEELFDAGVNYSEE